MGLLDAMRGAAREPSLYRREWQQTDNPIVAEARAQTLAIQRLQIWLRLAYSALALAVLLGYWGLSEGNAPVLGVVGIVIGILSVICVFVLRTGIAHGRKNVEAMLDALTKETSSPSI